MDIIRDDSFEDMAAAFQCFQIQALHCVLAKHGLVAPQARAICEDFTREFGTALDQFWVDSDAGKVLRDDEDNFVDTSSMVRYVVREHVVIE